ncbi:MAG: ATP-binding cassette domain-containing protein, partial [Desulfovibrionaceae bacterium]
MLLARKLTYAYPGGGAALSGVSLALEPGALLALAGANGSGKSTLLAVLAGLIEPTGGTLKLAAGAELGARELRSLARLVMQDADAQILGGTEG